jgi:hypothetical protein
VRISPTVFKIPASDKFVLKTTKPDNLIDYLAASGRPTDAFENFFSTKNVADEAIRESSFEEMQFTTCNHPDTPRK